jgi:pyruvate/2-oxoglutarate dehydrogenase complex dihydrolipoamide acyltransferase (E2) component
MLQSHLGSARVAVLAEADATELVALRQELKATLSGSEDLRLSFTSLFVKIAADALAKHPEMNATLVGDELQLLGEINVNVALALPDGNLIVPVVRGADKLNVIEIARQIADLVDRADRKKLKPADMRGGTFTLTNGGMLPAIRWTTPIVNAPQCAILGPGAVTPTAVVRDGEIVVRSMVALSLTFDHQAVNGYPASSFLQTIADMIADPGSLDIGL